MILEPNIGDAILLQLRTVLDSFGAQNGSAPLPVAHVGEGCPSFQLKLYMLYDSAM